MLSHVNTAPLTRFAIVISVRRVPHIRLPRQDLQTSVTARAMLAFTRYTVHV